MAETRVVEIDPVFIGVDEAAKFLGLHPREVYRLLDKGEITSVHHGRRRLVVVKTLRGYADRLMAAAAAR